MSCAAAASMTVATGPSACSLRTVARPLGSTTMTSVRARTSRGHDLDGREREVGLFGECPLACVVGDGHQSHTDAHQSAKPGHVDALAADALDGPRGPMDGARREAWHAQDQLLGGVGAEDDDHDAATPRHSVRCVLGVTGLTGAPPGWRWPERLRRR